MSIKERLDPAQFGIFADSEALGQLDEVDVEISPNFYSKSRPCEVCSRRKECQIPWSELYCLQYGIFPQHVGRHINRQDLFSTPWLYNQKFKCFHPDYRCACDPRSIVLFDITPTEAERVLNQAGRNGIISEDQQRIIHAIVPVVARLASRQGIPTQQGVIRHG
jgi:hypothetical protein